MDSIDGGAGNDTWLADKSAATANINIDLTSVNPQTYSLTTGGPTATVQHIEVVNLTTGSGNDTIVTTSLALNDTVNTSGGDDTITVAGGDDTVDGGSGVDRLMVDYHADTHNVFVSIGLSGGPQDGFQGQYSDGSGNSARFFNIENLTVTTGTGNDSITTKSGDDIISLGDGNDFADTGSGLDSIDGGVGNDTWLADKSAASSNINIDLTSVNPQSYSLTTGGPTATVQHIEAVNLTTGSGDDTIVTTSLTLNDTVNTSGGDDTITVAGGDDTVDGGSGVDRLVVDYHGDTHNVSVSIGLTTGPQDGFQGQYSDGSGNSARFFNIENLTVTTGIGNDSITTGTGNDVVSLGAGNDFINSGAGIDQIDGGADNDGWTADMSTAGQDINIDLTAGALQHFLGSGTETGIEFLGLGGPHFSTGSGNDTIVTTSGNFSDVIDTNGGNDTITVAGGDDSVDGGTGTDRLVVDYHGDANNVSVSVGVTGGPQDGFQGQYSDAHGNAIRFFNIENFTVTTGAGTDSITTGTGDDIISLGDGNDFANTSSGLDSIDGGVGNDTWQADKSAATANIHIDLTAGAQTYSLTTGGPTATVQNIEAVNLTTGSGNDTIVTTSLNLADMVNTNDGNDTITVAGGGDTVDGGTGTDRLIVDYHGDANNVFVSVGVTGGPQDGFQGQYSDGSGNSARFFNIENFTVTTGAGTDSITTGTGDDIISLGDGNDFANTSSGLDSIDGGVGNDTWQADKSAATANIHIDLTAGAQTYSLTTGGPTATVQNIEAVNLTTGSGNDTIVTTSLNLADMVNTNDGNDTITVAGGSDTVDGGTGTDRLIVDYHGDANNVSVSVGLTVGPQDGFHGQYTDSVSNSVSFGNIENFTVTTGSGTDSITTGTGDDVISLGDGNDSANTGSGLDSIDGGVGNDTWLADKSAATANINIDLTSVNPQTYSLTTGGPTATVQNIEAVNLSTGSGNDTIVTTSLNLADTVNTNDGNDTITVAGGSDTVDGGTGTDRLIVDYHGDANNVSVSVGLTVGPQDGFHGQYTDSVSNSVSFGNIENFTVTTGSGNDNITTGDGNDVINLGTGNDIIHAAGGTDQLIVDYGAAGTNINMAAPNGTGDGVIGDGTAAFTTAFFGIENFNIRTGSGIDTITTGAGNDVIEGGAGADTLDGGGGTNTASYAHDTAGVTVNLLTGVNTGGDAQGDTLTNFQNVTGGSGDDSLTGDNGDNVLDGGDGNDTLSGGVGNDTLTGGAGSDTLTGGAGNDIVQGGAGDDIIKYTVGDGGDTIDGGPDSINPSLIASSGDALNITGDANDNTLTVALSGGVITDFVLDGSANTHVTNVENVTVDLLAQSIGGADTLSYAGNTQGVIVDLGANTGTGFTAITDVENLIGGDGNDTLTGDNNANILTGGKGDDTLDGGAGNDTVVFSGNQADYSVASVAGGLQFTDNTPGRDGVDIIKNIELVKLAAAPEPPLPSIRRRI